jgi:hypothetical protein
MSLALEMAGKEVAVEGAIVDDEDPSNSAGSRIVRRLIGDNLRPGMIGTVFR